MEHRSGNVNPWRALAKEFGLEKLYDEVMKNLDQPSDLKTKKFTRTVIVSGEVSGTPDQLEDEDYIIENLLANGVEVLEEEDPEEEEDPFQEVVIEGQKFPYIHVTLDGVNLMCEAPYGTLGPVPDSEKEVSGHCASCINLADLWDYENNN